MTTAIATPTAPAGALVKLFTPLCWAQGAYFLLTGLWPLVSIDTFQAVTGVKTDNWTGHPDHHWLVNTVAVLVLAIGACLLVAARRRRPSAEIVVLAVASAVGLIAIDVIYVQARVIAPIYLADAVAELVLLVGWGAFVVAWRRNNESTTLPGLPR